MCDSAACMLVEPPSGRVQQELRTRAGGFIFLHLTPKSSRCRGQKQSRVSSPPLHQPFMGYGGGLRGPLCACARQMWRPQLRLAMSAELSIVCWTLVCIRMYAAVSGVSQLCLGIRAASFALYWVLLLRFPVSVSSSLRLRLAGYAFLFRSPFASPHKTYRISRMDIRL
ncbi:hypothetical protein F503_00101 [Ophiostoma piceae UAMH 11346]|uniref:Uncharacterized protein n=1 Tax=Ophiostoma piceae (strain UAMH 11346) TaxID=1262450 RepID=S3BWM8_OPHP1|nr:hypothetical protein F503_00101 [Ophiostoma piceae UAMH 11346]